MASNSTALVKKTEDTKKFLIEQFKPVLSDYKTRDYNSDAWLKTAMMCIVENEELLKCLGTPAGQASLVHALRYAAGTGLSLNPQEGKAALIPYSGKVEYQVMKGGMVQLAMESKKVEFITADTVYEGDTFEIEKTMDGDRYRFKPALMDRGKVLGYFAAVKMKDGTCHVKWIDTANMEKHRDQYGKGVTNEKSAWKKSFDGMAQKTVLKALLRSLEISPDLTAAVTSDDRFEVDADVIDVTPEAEAQEPGPGSTSEEVLDKLEEEESEPPTEKTEKDLF